jgi:hypothetical protein
MFKKLRQKLVFVLQLFSMLTYRILYSIGNNTVIACGSIVTTNILENWIVAGIPAKVVRVLLSCCNIFNNNIQIRLNS